LRAQTQLLGKCRRLPLGQRIQAASDLEDDLLYALHGPKSTSFADSDYPCPVSLFGGTATRSRKLERGPAALFRFLQPFALLSRMLLIASEWGEWAVFGGLAILEACCFVGAGGGVAGTVRMSAGAGERAAIDDQVFLADGTAIKPALQDLAHSGRIAGLRGQRRPGHVWRHPVVGHRAPRVILGSRLREPDVSGIPGQLAAFQRPRDRVAVTD